MKIILSIDRKGSGVWWYEWRFENFDSILLEFKTVFHMTGNLGRVRRTSALMVTGGSKWGDFYYWIWENNYFLLESF